MKNQQVNTMFFKKNKELFEEIPKLNTLITVLKFKKLNKITAIIEHL